jgi:predicted DNA-binding transcriptional regulator AlpA
MTKGDTYSYPPRGLGREAAARYVGVGTTTFDRLVDERRMPKPIRIGKRVVWDRIKIERRPLPIWMRNRRKTTSIGP